MEIQFNFLAKNPQLPLFLLTEILTNEKNRALLLDILSQRVIHPLSEVKLLLDEEVKKGTVRPIQFPDLMINIISVNAITFLAFPILQDIAGHNESIKNLFAERRENNVQFVLAALRP